MIDAGGLQAALREHGLGAWVLYDTTTWFPTARVLRFGLADNDSAPSPDSASR